MTAAKAATAKVRITPIRYSILLPPVGVFSPCAYPNFLREQPILSLDEFDRPRAFQVIVRSMVDTTAHWVAPHQPSVISRPSVCPGQHKRYEREAWRTGPHSPRSFPLL